MAEATEITGARRVAQESAAAELARRFLRPEFVQRLARLDLRAKFIVEGFFSGLHASPTKGFSVEFSDYREYVPGDDTRQIDWRVWARTDRYYVKRFEAETNLRATLVLDNSGSMHYTSGPSGSLTKAEYSGALAAALAYMMIRQGDRVGLVLFSDRIRTQIPEKSKGSQLVRLWTALAESMRRPEGRTDLAGTLDVLARRLTRAGLVIIFSDLLTEPEPVVRGIRALRHQGQDVILFQVLDNHEVIFPIRQSMLFEDPETGMLYGAGRESRAAYLRALGALQQTYRAAAAEARADYVPLDTQTPFDLALLRFLAYRRARH